MNIFLFYVRGCSERMCVFIEKNEHKRSRVGGGTAGCMGLTILVYCLVAKSSCFHVFEKTMSSPFFVINFFLSNKDIKVYYVDYCKWFFGKVKIVRAQPQNWRVMVSRYKVVCQLEKAKFLGLKRIIYYKL